MVFSFASLFYPNHCQNQYGMGSGGGGNIQCPGGRDFTLFKSCPGGGMALDETDTCINLLTHFKHVVFHALSIYVL